MVISKYLKFTLIIVTILSIFRLILLQLFNLVPQEAYYWLYIQRPALSYFDHPPICSYTIGLFTLIFGKNEFGVRFGMVLYSIGTIFFMYKLSQKFFNDDKSAFLTIIFLNLTIFFNLQSIISTPDSPLLFFWAGAMYFYFKAIFETGKWRYWLLGGLFAGIGLASKYTSIFIFFNLILYFIFSKNWKKIFSIKFICSIIIALFAFSPVIIWNFQNGFASFLFQTSNRAKGVKSIGFNYLLQLLASQTYELTPIFLILLIVIFIKSIQKFINLELKELYLLIFTYPITIFFFLVSLTSLVKMNWIMPAYLSLMILSVNYFEKSNVKIQNRIKYLGLPISIVLIMINIIIIIFPFLTIQKGDTWTGWKELANRVISLKEKADINNNNFIFSNEYKIPAELSFYTPYKNVILAENIYGKPALQFDYWYNVKKFKGWDGFFIYSDFNSSFNIEDIKKYFKKVEFIEEMKIIKNNKIFRRFYIYHCVSYNPEVK